MFSALLEVKTWISFFFFLFFLFETKINYVGWGCWLATVLTTNYIYMCFFSCRRPDPNDARFLLENHHGSGSSSGGGGGAYVWQWPQWTLPVWGQYVLNTRLSGSHGGNAGVDGRDGNEDCHALDVPPRMNKNYKISAEETGQLVRREFLLFLVSCTCCLLFLFLRFHIFFFFPFFFVSFFFFFIFTLSVFFSVSFFSSPGWNSWYTSSTT